MSEAVLLDTHALVWFLFNQRQLSDAARRHIDTATTIYVSAVSIYEIDFKRRSERARGTALVRIPKDMPVALPALGLTLLDVTAHQAWIAAQLPFAHGDPWDRILVAQARDLGVPLISIDAALRSQAGDTPVIW